ncbi:pheromone processing endoprotease [Entomophthora muscae]|uniref:Pheromone processing endoprotease n=1 Tax=Entomophthora muscae TaxID=34485 RepID=A0ACC2T7S5_9FUNG|nr:pheromone processing endoprotease [Entomophthora muscae]
MLANKAGVNFHHEDLKENYSADSSYDFDSGTNNPYPHLEYNTHGTPCAGLVAAKRNGKCGSGVAYNANFSAIRLPMKVVTDSQDAIALNFKYQTNAIYSNSWGPGSNITETYPLSGVLKDALQHGADHGRNGKGSIFVFSSGNSAASSNNCGFVGYLNSIHTITVGAVNKYDQHISYAEGCSNLMITAYSSDPGYADIQTTAFRESTCNGRFSGTSAAAPMVSGIIALILSERPELNWRDVQHLLIRTARMVDPSHKSWRRTYSGRYFSTQYGYGVVDGEKILSFLPRYQLIERQVILQSQTISKDADLEPSPLLSKQSYRDHIHITRTLLGPNKDMLLEHVLVHLNITHQCRSMLHIQLISPRKVVSDIVIPRARDLSNKGFYEYPVLTLAHWDEPAHGIWTLEISNAQSRPAFTGKLISWSLQLHGRVPNSKDSSPRTPSTTPKPTKILVKDEL